MNREIKFRAWDGEKMHHWDSVTHKATNQITNTPYPKLFYLPMSWLVGDSNDWQWMQFTGLLDKNGKEIYECDILEIDNYFKPEDLESEVKIIGVVKYSLYGQRGFCLFDNREITEESCYPKHILDLLDITPNKSDYERHWKVIGNIYENPELVK